MGKITVKHYLEKRVNPFFSCTDSEENKLMYPVYVQIIYNKFSTNKRSKTLINSTEKGFEKYLKTNKIDKKEFDTTLSIDYTLEKEIKDITNCIQIINDRNLDVNRKKIIELIDVFSNNIISCLTFIARTDFEIENIVNERKDGYDRFILAFDGKSNLLKNIAEIKKYTNIDLLPYVKNEDINKWTAILTVENCFGYNVSFSEFIYSDYEKILKKKLRLEKVEKFEVIITEIKKLIESFIHYHSNYDIEFDEKFVS